MLNTANSLSAEFAKVSPEKQSRRRFGFINLEAASPRSANPSPSPRKQRLNLQLIGGRKSAIHLDYARSEAGSPRSPSARLVEAAVAKVLYESPVKAGAHERGPKGALEFSSIGVKSWSFDDEDDGDSLVDPTISARGQQVLAHSHSSHDVQSLSLVMRCRGTEVCCVVSSVYEMMHVLRRGWVMENHKFPTCLCDARPLPTAHPVLTCGSYPYHDCSSCREDAYPD